MATIDARLKELENLANSRNDGDLWVEMRNNRVRVDRDAKRGKEREFKSTFEAAQWLENEINEAPGAIGSVVINDLCELHPNPDQLREEIAPFLIPTLDLGACLFGKLKTNGPADLKLWLMASKVYELRIFDWKSEELTEEQVNTFTALCIIFAGGREPGAVKKFFELIKTAGKVYG
jgi:hypothetical protein